VSLDCTVVDDDGDGLEGVEPLHPAISARAIRLAVAILRDSRNTTRGHGHGRDRKLPHIVSFSSGTNSYGRTTQSW
jgi:hypothetical protein